MTFTAFARRGTSALALGIYLAATPLAIDLGGAGGLGLVAPKAFAKDGRSGDDDSGGGRDDRSDDGGRDDRSGSSGSGRDDRSSDDRSGSSGSSRDDRSDDSRSGSSSRDDRGDDSRSGSSGRDDRSDDRSGSRSSSSDDRGGDDRRGRGGDDRGDDSTARSATAGAAAGGSSGRLRVVKFERSATGVEVVYSNGVKEEVENGRFEQKNAAGRTIVQRPATEADLARIDSNARNSGITAARGGTGGGALPAGSQARRVEVGANSVEVDYNTGWREEITGNRYELKDPNNNTVVERVATQSDVDRLIGLAGR